MSMKSMFVLFSVPFALLLLASPVRADGDGEIEDVTPGAAAPAAADETVPSKAPKEVVLEDVTFGSQVPEAPPAVRRVYVPSRREWVCREVEVPAVTRTCCEPVYEDVEVPVYGTRCEPVYREIQVPRYTWEEIPVTTCRSVPVWETVEVPVYERRCVPETREVCDPCTGQTTVVTCGYRTEVVQCGTRSERRLAGWRTEEVPCGTVRRPVQDGCETVRVLCGTRRIVEQTGTRTETRQTGWRQTCVVVRPATTRTVRECVCVPARWEEVPCEAEAR